jgi:hypothetical protein
MRDISGGGDDKEAFTSEGYLVHKVETFPLERIKIGSLTSL